MDLELIENGDGGDLIKNPKDLSVIEGFENMVYLAFFGGNVEQSTPVLRLESEQAGDWWGNTLLFPDDAKIQFNSEVERILNKVALNSFGRTKIIEAMKKDTAFMRDFANITYGVTIIGPDKVILGVKLVQPDNLQEKAFIFIWDSTNKELMDREFQIASGGVIVSGRFFDFSFDPSFETLVPLILGLRFLIDFL